MGPFLIMKKLITIFIILTGLSYPQGIKERAEEMITAAFPGGISFTSEKYILPKDLKLQVEKSAKQRFNNDFVYIYKITSAGKTSAYAFIDNVNGKAMPITFLVILDTSGKIISTGIIKYREAYGGGVQQENWNKQFAGKDKNASFKVGEDINSITGATISVNSVTSGIKKIILLFNEIKNTL